MKKMTYLISKSGSEYRRDYQSSSLEKSDLLADPLEMLTRWINDANPLLDGNAMVLSTCATNQPSSRIVLLKEIVAKGLVWFTNYNSQKGLDLAANPAASLLFFWATLERQVRIEGVVEKISTVQSDAYFQERPIDSRLSAWASPQSQKIESRELLEEAMINAKTQFEETIPRPDHWGGYCLSPNRVEFWQGRPSRLHDRWVYQKTETNDWDIFRLAP